MFTTDILETYEASDVFDAVCATDVGTNLTKSHLLLQACEQTGVSVEESILVGDSTIEAKGAEEIGMDFLAVLYGWGFKTKEETENYKMRWHSVISGRNLSKSHGTLITVSACKTVHK